MAADKGTKLTPMMERYLEVKRETPGSLLLFRMGDFYELFYEDAEVASKVLGLTLTSRDKGSANPIAMAGFPYHALDGYLQKLIRAGHKAAICEQVEDPKTAKGLVRREVTRIVTPGTLTDDALLDPRQSNYLAALNIDNRTCGAAWLELSTGQFQCLEIQRPKAGATELAAAAAMSVLCDELSRLRPSECLVPSERSADFDQLDELRRMTLTERPPWNFGVAAAKTRLLEHFGVRTLEGFDLEADGAGIAAAGALLEYVQDTQKSTLGHITKLEPVRRGRHLLIDESTRRSLELTQTLREGRREGSLLDVLDETVTPMGARLLAERLSNPLTDVQAIEHRLDAVDEFAGDMSLRDEIRDLLKQAYDLQRLSGRVATLRASPRDLGALAATLAILPRVKALLTGRQSGALQTLEARIDLCEDVHTGVTESLVDDPPQGTADGGMIRAGCDAQLDEFRDLARGGKQWIAAYQKQEIERTGITSLKIGFNKVFGYYLEVTAANKDKVPDDYIRKQTLKNQERFITPQLKEHEDKVLRAEERAIALEQEMFAALRQSVADECRRLLQTAEALAELDVVSGLAHLAVRRSYIRPVMTDVPLLDVREGRHPVLDALQPSGAFVPNDVRLGVAVDESAPAQGGGPYVALITGPNMAGKSTYIRQSALLTVMAQIGSFVPAAAATIGVADRVFARVGASDELGKGQSTFMVEMTETARILNAATARSLVILDEIGRGTSTYDGVSLAWAITEHLHDEVGCRTLFATHYHELTDLQDSLSGLVNWNVAVHEQDGDVVFLHKIVPGAADRSYGIHVARIAGVPPQVVARADVVLSTLEADHHDDAGRPTVPARRDPQAPRQLSLFGHEPHPLLEELRALEINSLTPLAALQELARLREQLG